MLEKIEGGKKGMTEDEMDGITDSMDMSGVNSRSW